MLSYIYPLTIGKTNILYTDFGKFYNSQQMFVQGKNIYSPIYFVRHKINFKSTPPRLVKSKHVQVLQLGSNLNPPFFTLLSFPFAYLSYSHALWLWTFLSILAGSLAVLLLQHKLDPSSLSRSSSLLLLIGFFSYFPSFVSLQFGQVSLLLLPLLVLAWRAAQDKKTLKAGIFLGFAASLKPFIGLFLFYFLIRKEWRGFFSFIATVVICIMSTAIVFGLDTYLSYYHACQQIKWAASSWNVSLYGFLLRLIGGNESNAALIALPGLIAFVYPLLTALIFLAIIRFLLPQANIESSQKTNLDFSIVLLGMLLLSPLGWFYYFPFLSIPLLILWDMSKKGIYPIALPLCLATLVLFSNIPINLFNSDQIKFNNILTVFLSSSVYFAVLVGLVGLLFLVRHHVVHKFSLHFEKIPPALLLLVGIVVFLPSLLGITKAGHNWIRYEAYYSKEYSLVAHRD